MGHSKGSQPSRGAVKTVSLGQTKNSGLIGAKINISSKGPLPK